MQFDKAVSGAADVYGIDQFLQEVEAGSKAKSQPKKHGLEMPESRSSAKSGKRARVDDDDDDEQ